MPHGAEEVPFRLSGQFNHKLNQGGAERAAGARFRSQIFVTEIVERIVEKIVTKKVLLKNS